MGLFSDQGEEGAELELVLTLPGHGESWNVVVEKKLRNERAAEKKKEKMKMAKVSATGRESTQEENGGVGCLFGRLWILDWICTEC